MKKISVIVPCYNEEEVVNIFYDTTKEIVNKIENYYFEFIFVDDGSRDKTLEKLVALASEHEDVKYITFSRNFGKEAAMYAGLKLSDGDYCIVMDADLQHPPALIPIFIEGINEGYDCCAAMRTTRKGESKIRSLFSKTFYKISNSLTDVKLAQNAVDYRIMSRQMVNAVLALSEVQRFSKGIFAWVGFKTKWVPYENVERTVGTTKWSFTGLLRYAIDGITAFSIKPLRMLTGIGFFISILAILYMIWTIAEVFIYGITVPGYATLLTVLLFMGGIIEVSLGILGEYIGRIYMESKNRPIFILKETNIELTSLNWEKEK
ncbi:MAG: glycosyltransferase family 2 protein [Lachnospiraceae bacterium]|nr:glycosyltransferase family 2 protein [Lachnospiraceae bacterium]